jgi:hypothetical protein
MGTKSSEPSRVTAVTKSRIDCFALPSFHDGSGSLCANAGPAASTIPPAAEVSNAPSTARLWT